MDLSVIVVSWNVAGPLSACLDSISSGAQGSIHEVIVVDNCSSDGSADMVATRYPEVRLILNPTNVGYAAANNQGLRASIGRCVLLVNPDAILSVGAAAQMVRFLDEQPRAGACAPLLLTQQGTPQPYAFGDDPSPTYLARRALVRMLAGRSVHDWGNSAVRQVDWVSGACMLARSQAVTEIGGFDTDYFAYYEDVDLCLRLRRAGWSVYHYPLVSVEHAGGQSMSQSRVASGAYYRSLELFYAKHYGPIATQLLRLVVVPRRLLVKLGRPSDV